MGGFGAWAVLTKISGAIVAEGQIEVDQNRQVIQHPDGGVVAAIAVDEGRLSLPATSFYSSTPWSLGQT